jgi:hypothetical protein
VGGRQPLLHHAEERGAVHHGGFIEKGPAAGAGEVPQLPVGEGQGALVGGDHVAAGAQSGPHVIGGRLPGAGIQDGDLHHHVGGALLDEVQGLPGRRAPAQGAQIPAPFGHFQGRGQIQPLRIPGRPRRAVMIPVTRMSTA